MTQISTARPHCFDFFFSPLFIWTFTVKRAEKWDAEWIGEDVTDLNLSQIYTQYVDSVAGQSVYAKPWITFGDNILAVWLWDGNEWFRLKYFNNSWMDWHEVFYRLLQSPLLLNLVRPSRRRSTFSLEIQPHTQTAYRHTNVERWWRDGKPSNGTMGEVRASVPCSRVPWHGWWTGNSTATCPYCDVCWTCCTNNPPTLLPSNPHGLSDWGFGPKC